MPLALDPEARFELVLESDAGKEDPPTFVFRHMPARDWRKVAKVNDELDELAARGLDAQLDAIEEALNLALVDWRAIQDLDGAPIPFERETLPDVLTPFEMMELVGKVVTGSRPSVAEKNASGSQSPSDTDESASTATPPNPAGSGPQNESPSSSTAAAED